MYAVYTIPLSLRPLFLFHCFKRFQHEEEYPGVHVARTYIRINVQLGPVVSPREIHAIYLSPEVPVLIAMKSLAEVCMVGSGRGNRNGKIVLCEAQEKRP